MQNKTDTDCSRCGDCCRQFTVKIPIRFAERSGWPVFYNRLHKDIDCQAEQGDYGLNIVIQVRRNCSMLIENDDGTTTCKIYDRRPEVCRDWPQDGVRQNCDIPRCTLMPPRDEELDKAEAEMYAYHNIPPIFEEAYRKCTEKDMDVIRPWPLPSDVVTK